MTDWRAIEDLISRSSGEQFRVQNAQRVGGGSINDAYVVQGEGRRAFVKFNQASRLNMFEAEAEGLAELDIPKAIRVPNVLGHGIAGDRAFLALEYLPLSRVQSHSDQLLGQQLADLHRHESNHFGWHRDNTLGSTPQINSPHHDWAEFFGQQRLGYQLDLAQRNGHSRALSQGQRLINDIHEFFTDYKPRPSLLHGDLWSGNYAYTNNGTPVIFDPAVYYGDRESDIAMTELFGGFSANFYASYREHYPLDSGYSVRSGLYKLYHVLNHVNLFGGGYLHQAQHLIGSLVSEIA